MPTDKTENDDYMGYDEDAEEFDFEEEFDESDDEDEDD